MRQRITIEGRNVDDVFRLPCVTGVYKQEDDTPLYFISEDGVRNLNQFATIGDSIVEDDNGCWHVEKSGNIRKISAKSNKER